MKKAGLAAGGLLVALVALSLANGSSRETANPEAKMTNYFSKTALARLTLPFISNRGQVDARVAYYASTLAGTVYVTKQGLIVHSLPARGSGRPLLAEAGRRPSTGWTLTQRLVTSAALHPRAEGAGAARVNYFRSAASRRRLRSSRRPAPRESTRSSKKSRRSFGSRTPRAVRIGCQE